jgi:hypothetical protein
LVPACWSWEVPPVLDREEEIARRLAEEEGKPERLRYGRACIELILDGDPSVGRMGMFHQDRCAICGVRRGVVHHLVVDHCHKTGQVRGYLCRPCNTREGRSGPVPVLIRYRRLHPAAILDVYEPYTGRDWLDGWYLGEVRLRDAEAWGARPVTPWPVWGRESALAGGE